MRITYEGQGPGIPGAPIYDGTSFSGSAAVTTRDGWIEALVNSLDGRSAPLVKPLLQPWNDLFFNQTSWTLGASWLVADGTTVTLTGKKAFAGLEGVAGEATGKSIGFCVSERAPLPLYAKVLDNGVTLEYSLVEAGGF